MRSGYYLVTLCIGVIGSGDCTPEVAALAEEVGAGIAERGAVLICGGLGGVMEAAARGARLAGGRTVGILPGTEPASANPYIEIPIVTGMGYARNVIIVRTARVLIAISGSYGTLSEIAHALALEKPVVGLQTWDQVPGVRHVTTPREALDMAFALCRER